MRDDTINILDCTLRDGGYINDWCFGKNIIRNIIANLVDANIDFIEVGFLRNCDYSEDVSCYNNVREISDNLPKNIGNSNFVAMILYTNYDIDKLEKCDGTVKYIRVTFHNYDIDEGLEYCRKVQAKGYQLFINPINIMGYSDEELLGLIRRVNLIKPFGFSIVDTFGSMSHSDLLRIYSLCENNLDKSIALGVHLHENMSMAFSLAQEFLRIKSPNRKCVIDGSLYGMGRKPGNLCVELMANYLLEQYGRKYKLDPILDAIEEYINPIRDRQGWGYSIEYFLSAKSNIHRNYAEHYYKKRRLTAKGIEEILEQIDSNRRGKFDIDYADELYVKYLDCHVEDDNLYSYFEKYLQGKYLILVAPGKSSDYAAKYISSVKNSKVVITANFCPTEYSADYCFFSNMKRFEEYKQYIGENTLITSNILRLGVMNYLTLDYMKLASRHGDILDSCGILLLRFLERVKVETVHLVGFDGFHNRCSNYYKGHIEEHTALKIEDENTSISDEIRKMRKSMNIIFETKSVYGED